MIAMNIVAFLVVSFLTFTQAAPILLSGTGDGKTLVRLFYSDTHTDVLFRQLRGSRRVWVLVAKRTPVQI